MKQSARTNVLFGVLAAILLSLPAAANTQLLLSRDAKLPDGEYKGIVDLAVSPGFDNALVSITVDGQKLSDALHSPYHVAVDLGPTAIEHKIVVTAYTADKGRRVQWTETINRGMLPLTVKVQPVDLANRVFEAKVTASKDDPITAVELRDSGKAI